jgi:hypothetical protein
MSKPENRCSLISARMINSAFLYSSVNNEKENSVSKLDMDGRYLGTFNVGLQPMGISLHYPSGADVRIWVVNHYSNNLIMLNISGEIQNAINTGTGPISMGNMIHP